MVLSKRAGHAPVKKRNIYDAFNSQANEDKTTGLTSTGRLHTTKLNHIKIKATKVNEAKEKPRAYTVQSTKIHTEHMNRKALKLAHKMVIILTNCGLVLDKSNNLYDPAEYTPIQYDAEVDVDSDETSVRYVNIDSVHQCLLAIFDSPLLFGSDKTTHRSKSTWRLSTVRLLRSTQSGNLQGICTDLRG